MMSRRPIELGEQAENGVVKDVVGKRIVCLRSQIRFYRAVIVAIRQI